MQRHTGAKIIPAQLQAFDVLTKRNRKPMIFNLKLFCHFWKDLKQCARVPQREMTEKPLSKWLEPPAKLRDNLKQHAVTRWVINSLPRRFHNYLPSCLHLDYKVHRSKYPLICLIIVIIIVVEVFPCYLGRGVPFDYLVFVNWLLHFWHFCKSWWIFGF